jgi:hypothetical protein
MKRMPTEAERSILLDYISPIIPTGLWRAIKNKHWAVVLSTTGFLILKLAVVFSTSLLVLAPVTITLPQNGMLLNTTSFFDAGGYSIADVGPDAAYQYYGNQVRGLSWPAGTNDLVAVQTFNIANSAALNNAKFSGEVSGFSVEANCEKVKAAGQYQNVTKPWRSIQQKYIQTNISTPSCKLNNVVIGQSANHGYFRLLNKDVNYQGFISNFTCGSDNFLEMPKFEGNKSSDDVRLLITMSEVRWSYVNSTGNATLPYTTGWNVTDFVGYLCKPSYSVDKYQVTMTQNQTILSQQKIAHTNQKLVGYTDEMLLRGVQAVFDNATFGQGGEDYIFSAVPSYFMMLSGLNNYSRQAPLLQEDGLLEKLSIRTIQGVGAQVAAEHLMMSKKDFVAGSMSSIRDRLVVKRLSVGFMTTAFGLMAIMSASLISIRPKNVVPNPPDSISSTAAVLASSHAMRKYMRSNTVQATTTKLKHLFGRDKFRTMFADKFSVEPLLNHGATEISEHKMSEGRHLLSENVGGKERAYLPLGVTTWFFICLVIAPLGLIGLIEGLQQLSNQKHGIVELDSKSATPIGANLVPALVMLGVATMYTTLDFAVAIIAPFVPIRSGTATAPRSIGLSLVGKLPPHGFFLSLKHQHFYHCVTIIAAFASSFLTIIVSGLYSPEWVQLPGATQIQQSDVFNFTHIDTSIDDNFAAAATKLIWTANLSYPQWTYEDLVFPTISAPKDLLIVDVKEQSQDAITNIKATIPAIRGSLKCFEPAPDTMNLTAFWYAGTYSTFVGGATAVRTDPGSIKLRLTAKFPWSLCDRPPVDSPATALWSQLFLLNNDTETTASKTTLGAMAALQWSGFSITETSHDLTSTRSLDVSAYGCPSVMLTLGSTSATKSNRVGTEYYAASLPSNVTYWDLVDPDFSISVCSQKLEEVKADVTLRLPSYSIDLSSPPIADESTKRPLINANTSTPSVYTDIWADIQSNISTNSGRNDNWFSSSLGTFHWAVQGRNIKSATLDGAIKLFGEIPGNPPLDQMIGHANRPVFLGAASRAFGQYIAQFLNANGRAPISAANGQPEIMAATVLTPHRRLVQHRAPTLALEVILGFMALCGILARILLLGRLRLLQHNPCSIGGRMILLGRSELCNTRKVIPEGAEAWDAAKRSRHGLFEGWFFGLGWWSEACARTGDDSMSFDTSYSGAASELGDRIIEKWYGIDIGRPEK